MISKWQHFNFILVHLNSIMQLLKFQHFQQVINCGDIIVTCQVWWQVFFCLILFDFCLFTNVGLGASKRSNYNVQDLFGIKVQIPSSCLV